MEQGTILYSMNYALTESNIVLIYERQINEILSDSKIDELIQDETGERDQLIKTSIGENRTVVSTSGYIQVNISSQMIVIASAKVNEGGQYKNRSMANIAFGIADFLKEQGIQSVSYGFNFVLSFEESDYATQVGIVRSKYFNDDLLREGEELKFAYPTIRIKKDECIITYSYNSLDRDQNIEGVKQMVALGNVHHSESLLFDDSTDLHQEVKDSYEKFSERMKFDE
jgi:hypothetical protein